MEGRTVCVNRLKVQREEEKTRDIYRRFVCQPRLQWACMKSATSQISFQMSNFVLRAMVKWQPRRLDQVKWLIVDEWYPVLRKESHQTGDVLASRRCSGLGSSDTSYLRTLSRVLVHFFITPGDEHDLCSRAQSFRRSASSVLKLTELAKEADAGLRAHMVSILWLVCTFL
jgi:hypothetical protein